MFQESGEAPGEVPERSARFRSWAGRALAGGLVAGLLAIVALPFLPTLTAGFVWDDRGDVIENPASTPAGFLAALGRTNRPLLKASYALQRAATGENPWPFHLLNLLLHLAVGCAVALWIARLVGGVDAGSRASTAIGWGAAMLWAIHPSTVEAVAPISGRSVLLSTLLLLAALLLATRSEPPRGRAAWAAASCAAAAPLARETALVLPALLLLWLSTIGADEPFAAKLRRFGPVLSGWAVGLAGILTSQRHRELVAFSLAERSPLDSVRGNLSALVELGRLWLAPGLISVDPTTPVDSPWLGASTVAAGAAVACAALVAVACRRRLPAVSFGIGWTLLSLLPTNSIVWRLDPVAPRALYLASIGPLILLGLVVERAAFQLDRTRESRWRFAPFAAGSLGIGALVGALALSAVATHRRSALYADPIALWADAVAKSPERARPWLNLGVELMIADRLDEAERALVTASHLDPLEGLAGCALDAVRIRRSALTLTADFQRRSR